MATAVCQSVGLFPNPMFHFAVCHVDGSQSVVAASRHDARRSPQRGRRISRPAVRCSPPATRCRRTPRALAGFWSALAERNVPPRDATRSHLATDFEQGTWVAANDRLRGDGALARQTCIVTRCLAGCTPNLLQKRNALLCIVGLDIGQALLVSFVHLFEYIVPCHYSLWHTMLKRLFDVRATQ